MCFKNYEEKKKKEREVYMKNVWRFKMCRVWKQGHIGVRLEVQTDYSDREEWTHLIRRETHMRNE